ncbi:MAG: LLM class flavin-dependent oxidoreductase [Acidimicrobiia bacterium]|nr:LLM class flavin-dependent oxidoreductase [Acidimicrobiia bacterium]
MKHALLVPPVGQFSDPRVLVELAVAAEVAGWDGVFVWDHVLRAEPPLEIADPWIALAAIAMATRRVRIGPAVTPLTRRRPVKLARETVSLDHLSGGRLTLGLGLGVDSSRELSGLGEVLDPRTRGERLDEGAELLCAMWSGDTIDYHGDHFVAEQITVLPRPVQQPRIPLWFAARGKVGRPVRRAARYDGIIPIEVDERELSEMLDVVVNERGSLDGFDIAVRPAGSGQYRAFRDLGATWTFVEPPAGDPELLQIAATNPTTLF